MKKSLLFTISFILLITGAGSAIAQTARGAKSTASKAKPAAAKTKKKEDVPTLKIGLVSGEQVITPVYDNIKGNEDNTYKIKITLAFSTPGAKATYNNTEKITFAIQNIDLPDTPQLPHPEIIVPVSAWMISGKRDTTIAITLGKLKDTLKTDALGILSISGQPAGQFIIREKGWVATSARDTTGPIQSGMVEIIDTSDIYLHYFAQTGKPQQEAIKIHLKLKGDYKAYANQIVFAIDSGFLSDNAQIMPADAAFTISKGVWDSIVNKNSGNLYVKLRIRTLPGLDTQNDIQTSYITIKGIPGQGQQIRLSRLTPNKPFWVEIGTNFDFVDNLKANNLYGGVFMYKKDVGRIFGHSAKNSTNKDRPKDKNNFSMFGGVYESKSISTDQSLSSNITNLQYLDNSVFIPSAHPNDSGIVHRDTGTVIKSVSVTNLGLFFSPQVRLTKKMGDEDGVHVFASLWGEVVWQRVATNYDYSATAAYDVIHVPHDSIGYYKYKTVSSSADYRSHFFGVGLPIYLKEGVYNLYLNSVFGYSNQVGLLSSSNNASAAKVTDPAAQDLRNSFFSNEQITPKWRWFYLSQFRLNEERYGIAFTGEIRGVISNSGTYKPLISLALSKKFDLSKLIEFAK